MDIVYSGNKKVLIGIELSILSILMKSKSTHHFYILSMDIDFLGEKGIGIHESDLTNLKRVISSFSPLNKISLIDVKNDYYDILYNSKYRDTHYTPYTFARLFIYKHIDSEKFLYLDADTLCYSNFDAFEEIDINNREAAVVKDALGKFWINRHYFNGGVLLVNLKYCKQNKVFEKVIEYLLKHKMYFGEQSAMYHIFEKPLFISNDYNEQRKVKPTTVIKHFCQGIKWFPLFKVYNIKQWQVSKVHNFLKCNEFDDVYNKYIELFNDKIE